MAATVGATSSRSGTIEDEMSAQEELLRRGARAVRVTVLRDAAVSYGVRVPSDAPYLRRARAEGLPTVARTTGGTGVLHDVDDIVWAIVVPRSDPEVGRDFVRAYARLGRGVLDGLAAVGVAARWGAAPGLTADYCPLSSQGEALEAGGRILGGAAQHASPAALLHHGSIAFDVDRPRIDRLFGFGPPSPSDHLGGVHETAASLAPTAAAAAVARALERQLGL